MRLKRLSLHGYKTFATKTDFEFGHGITAIVGPNGCGKSNISDAIRWVLGEQSYSTLRGRRTTDMIFAGSRSRARAGMAQAVLTLDNEEGWLSLDFSEIEIGRRAYRSGENEYILNQRKVRLRDVNELLANSGLGRRTYTIIGQGLVDQALSLRAEERRALFEEAAGITHYKLKRAETIRHLDETKHNLERVYDILAEIEPRLRSLKRQANRARNYEHVAADLQHHLKIWFGFHWEQARAELRTSRADSQSAQDIWDKGRSDHLALQQNINQTRSLINELVQSIQEKEEDRELVRAKLVTANRDAAILAERLDFTQRRLSEIKEDIPRLERQKANAQEELDKANYEFESAAKLIDTDVNALRYFEDRVQVEESEIEKWELNVADLDLSLSSTQAQLNQASGSLVQLRERLSARNSERISPEDIELKERKVKERRQAARELETAVGEKRSALENLEADLHDVGEDIRSLSIRQRKNRDDNNRLELDVAKLESRQQILETMNKPDDFDLSSFPSNLGYLEELITIQNEYEVAIRNVLSESIKTLVIAGEEELWDVVSRIPPNRYVANYQTIESQATGGMLDSPDIIGPASEFVTSEQPITNLIDLLLGRVLLVSTNHKDALKLARELRPGYSVVTKDGLIFLAGGIIKSPAVFGQELLKRREELESLKDELAEKSDQLVRNKNESTTLQEGLAEHGNIENDLSENIRQAKDDIGDSERRLFELKHALDTAENDLRQRIRNQETLEKDIRSLEERISEAENQIGSYKSQSNKFESSIELANLELKALPASEIADERRHLEQAVEATKTIVAGRQAVVDSRRATLVQIDEQLDRIGDRIQDLRSREIDLQLEEHLAVAVRLQEEMDALITDTEPDRASLREKRDYLASLEKKLSEQLVQNQAAEERYLQARLALNQADNRIEGLRERISTDLGLVDLPVDDDEIAQSPLPIKDVVGHLPSVDELPQDIEQAIQRLRGQLHRMGGVNPEAPAEYHDTKQRYDFLQQQIVDLTATIEQLQEVIIELDELTSKAFVDTVQKVDENFGEVFRRLFGGGTGRLVLTDPDHLTSTGVDIVARLPNRREQALGLLSGGERSLTATALVFSLLMVSPTPFCVLDEVDAMLDEANINRFRELLKEMSQQTQFIIITHNRGTVQVAESVYGISMGADSASQVISIKPEEYLGFAGTG